LQNDQSQIKKNFEKNVNFEKENWNIGIWTLNFELWTPWDFLLDTPPWIMGPSS
jgi:hypothetical protein